MNFTVTMKHIVKMIVVLVLYRKSMAERTALLNDIEKCINRAKPFLFHGTGSKEVILDHKAQSKSALNQLRNHHNLCKEIPDGRSSFFTHWRILVPIY